MTLDLAEDAVDAEDVLEYVFEQNQGALGTSFVEHPQTSRRVLSKGLIIDRDVVLGLSVREQDRATEGFKFVVVYGRERLHCNLVDVLIRPIAFFFGDPHAPKHKPDPPPKTPQTASLPHRDRDPSE